MGQDIFEHHTHPSVPWFDDERKWRAERTRSMFTVHTVLARPLDVPFHEVFHHTADHRDVTIPLYRLRRAQSAVKAVSGGGLIVEHWTPIRFVKHLRHCRLLQSRECDRRESVFLYPAGREFFRSLWPPSHQLCADIAAILRRTDMNPRDRTETGSDHLQSERHDPSMPVPKLTAFMIIGNRKGGEAAESHSIGAERAVLVSWGQIRRDREGSSGPFRVH